MPKHKKYDLIFSLGEACSCSETLRKNVLQVYSYPFDWLFGSNFIGRCNILAGRFEKFIEKEDLEYSYEERSIRCNAYYNKSNDITFNHDFLKELSFDDAYTLVKEKYKRRIDRLLNKINQSNSVLVVYIEMPLQNHIIVTNEEIIQGYSILKNVFGDKLNLLYIRNDKQNSTTEFLENNKITKISADYKDWDSELDYIVDAAKLKNIFSKYRLRLPFGYITYRKTIKILVNLVPMKSVRRKIKDFFHV